MTLSVPNAAPQQPESRKRVRRACEYCRKKRLKCTADKRPCQTCQMYGAECVSAPIVSGPRRRRRPASSAIDQTSHAVNNNNDSLPVDAELPGPPPDASRPSEPFLNASLSPGVLQDAPPELFTSPGTSRLSAFDHVIPDGSVDFVHDFWDFSNFIANCNPPNQQTAAEQLLALQSHPASGTTTAPKSPAPLPPSSGVMGGVESIFGLERLASQPTSSLGAIPSGIFHGKDKGNSHFLGFTSTTAVIALCVRESPDPHRRLAESESLRFIIDCGPICHEISCTEVKDMPPQQISVPSTTLAAQCINAFFEDYHASHPIADRNDLRLILDRYVCHGPQELGPLDQSILYLVTALGASSRPVMSRSKSIDFENLYALAWSLFPHVIASPSLASVQVLLLHVLYNIHWSKWSVAWVLCGLAVRIAQSIGLHVASPQDFCLESAQSKLRTRLWAVAVILDAHLSMSQGRPPACQLWQCDAELLSNKGGHLYVPELPWPLSEVLIWKVALARIQQKVNRVFSSMVTDDARLGCLEEVDLDLMRWKEELPSDFWPEQQMVLDSDAHTDIYMLHLDYFNLLQTIHWGLINHRPGTNPREYVTPRLRASESICLGACLSMVRTLNAMTDGDTRARSFRSRSDHFIAAMAIIYRDISRNPGKMSARTNLEYLRVIRLQLGRMADKHLLAASLTKLFENMLHNAEALIQEHGSTPM